MGWADAVLLNDKTRHQGGDKICESLRMKPIMTMATTPLRWADAVLLNDTTGHRRGQWTKYMKAYGSNR